MIEWKVIGACFEGEQINLNGVNPWNYSWRLVEANPVMLPHPCYASQEHRFFVYEIDSDIGTIKFAATELSAGAWGFYIPAS
ncbi:MAG: hypothetical protein ABSE63_06365 [Thermoguttaceae bacterium]|jgi:hypothetical protein